jgi:flagella basal body P-ring formation protein FlgA
MTNKPAEPATPEDEIDSEETEHQPLNHVPMNRVYRSKKRYPKRDGCGGGGGGVRLPRRRDIATALSPGAMGVLAQHVTASLAGNPTTPSSKDIPMLRRRGDLFQVVRSTETIGRGEKITPENVEPYSVTVPASGADMLKGHNRVVGKVAAARIPAGTVLLAQYVGGGGLAGSPVTNLDGDIQTLLGHGDLTMVVKATAPIRKGGKITLKNAKPFVVAKWESSRDMLGEVKQALGEIAIQAIGAGRILVRRPGGVGAGSLAGNSATSSLPEKPSTGSYLGPGPVVKTTESIHKGRTINASDVKLGSAHKRTLNMLVNLDEAVGMLAREDITKGSTIWKRMVKAPR